MINPVRMRELPDFQIENQVFFIKGSVTFQSVLPLWKKGLKAITLHPRVTVDMQQLKQCDSSLLALCTAWVRSAKEQNKEIVFINLPSFMQDLMRVYGLDSVLPFLKRS